MLFGNKLNFIALIELLCSMTMSETKKQISSILVNIATEAKYSRALDNE